MPTVFKASEHYIEEICKELGLNPNTTMRIVLDFQVRQVPRAYVTLACSDDVLSFDIKKEGLDLHIGEEKMPKRPPEVETGRIL